MLGRREWQFRRIAGGNGHFARSMLMQGRGMVLRGGEVGTSRRAMACSSFVYRERDLRRGGFAKGRRWRKAGHTLPRPGVLAAETVIADVSCM